MLASPLLEIVKTPPDKALSNLIYIASPYSEQTVCNGLQTPSSLNIPETVLARKHWHYSLTLSLVFE